AVEEGDYQRARAGCEESLVVCLRIGDKSGVAMPLLNLGWASLLEDRYGEAAALFEEGLTVSRELSARKGMIYCFEGLAAAAVSQGGARRAACLLGAAETVREVTGVSLQPLEQGIHERTLAAARAELDD